MLLAYNTNGLAHHDLIDAIALLAEIGYRGISITLDHGSLNPYDDRFDQQVDQVLAALEKYHLRCVIETGARYLLSPQTKHEPTLVTPGAAACARRIDFLCLAVKVANRLNADCVSLWSGIVRDGAGEQELFDRLAGGLSEVLAVAENHDVQLAFEPEPGMFIDTLESYGRLLVELSIRKIPVDRLQLTVDVGHLHCQQETPVAEKITFWGNRVANVHIEDMRAGVHEHLMFGHGEISFPPVIAALSQIGYAGLLSVELSRHSHDGPAAAREAYNFLRPLMPI